MSVPSFYSGGTVWPEAANLTRAPILDALGDHVTCRDCRRMHPFDEPCICGGHRWYGPEDKREGTAVATVMVLAPVIGAAIWGAAYLIGG